MGREIQRDFAGRASRGTKNHRQIPDRSFLGTGSVLTIQVFKLPGFLIPVTFPNFTVRRKSTSNFENRRE
jgi:hypothetical protein